MVAFCIGSHPTLLFTICLFPLICVLSFALIVEARLVLAVLGVVAAVDGVDAVTGTKRPPVVLIVETVVVVESS